MLERSHVSWTMDVLNDIVSICFGILLLFLACNIFTSLRLVARQYDIKDQETIRPQIYKKKKITLLWWLSSTSEGISYLIFVIFFTLAYFKAWKFYTQKCVNLQQKLTARTLFSVHSRQSKTFTLAPLLMLATNIMYVWLGWKDRFDGLRVGWSIEYPWASWRILKMLSEFPQITT